MSKNFSKNLFDSFKAGDEDAVAEVVGIYSRRLIPFIMKTVNSRAVAEEIAQDAFLNLWPEERAWSHTKLSNPICLTALITGLWTT